MFHATNPSRDSRRERGGKQSSPSGIEAALAKASAENRVATAIRAGMGAREAFETFGVLQSAGSPPLLDVVHSSGSPALRSASYHGWE